MPRAPPPAHRVPWLRSRSVRD